MMPRHLLPRLALAVVAALGLSACASATAEDAPTPDVAAAQDIVVVPPVEAAELLEAAPDGLVILDVRTAEEFAGGHLPGAVNLDFYADEFRDRLAALDRDVPYLLYCRSGNRSGQAREMMGDLGFAAVTDVDGGIVAWQAAGLPVTD